MADADDASKVAGKNDAGSDEDLPYGLSVDWIISVQRHNATLLEDSKVNNYEHKLFGLKTQDPLHDSTRGCSTSSDQNSSFAGTRDQVTNGSSVFFLSPRALRSPHASRTTILTTPLSSSPPVHVGEEEEGEGNETLLMSSPSQKQGLGATNIDQKTEAETETSITVTEKPTVGLKKNPPPQKQEETKEETNDLPKELPPRVLALHAMYSDFDIDGDGAIDFGELMTMLDHLRERSCTTFSDGRREYIMEEFNQEEAKEVMDALDCDNNGTVEEQEWTDWVITGLEQPDIRALLEAKNTILSKKLNKLLEAVERISDVWIHEELQIIKRRKSWYKDQENESGSRSGASGKVVHSADLEDVVEYAQRLHALVSDKKLTEEMLLHFFNECEGETDLVSRAACQLDHEGHHMCALHIMCWNSCFVPTMLRVFLDHAGVDTMHVSNSFKFFHIVSGNNNKKGSIYSRLIFFFDFFFILPFFFCFLLNSFCVTIQVEDGHGGTPIAHLLMNDGLDRKTVEECFAIFRDFDPAFVETYIESSGGFESLWEQSRSGEHFDEQNDVVVDDSSNFGEINGNDMGMDQINTQDSMVQAAIKGIPGLLSPEVEEVEDEREVVVEEEEEEEEEEAGKREESNGIRPPSKSIGIVPRVSILQEETEDEDTSSDEEDFTEKEHDHHGVPPPPPPPPHASESSGTVELLQNSPPHLRCPNGHVCICTVEEHSWSCDRCGTFYEANMPTHMCAPCDYDVCDDCCRQAWVTPYVDPETGAEVDDKKPYVIPSGVLNLLLNDEDASENESNNGSANQLNRISEEEVSF